MSATPALETAPAAAVPDVERSLRHKVYERERLTAQTGHYWGVEELSCKQADPMKFERFYSRLQSACMAARERFAISPDGPILQRPHQVFGGIHQREQVTPVVPALPIGGSDNNLKRCISGACPHARQRCVDPLGPILGTDN